MAREQAMLFDGDRCTGCRVCELMCSMTNRNEFNPRKSLIRILAQEDAGFYIPVLDIRCTFCGECADACPTGSITIVCDNEAINAMKGARIGRIPVPVGTVS